MRYLYIIYFLSTLTILSQESQIPINTQTIFFSINHSYQIPAGNLANRFGHNSDISFTLAYLAKNNILVNLEAGFLFGPTVKEPTLFQLIDGDNGNLISQNGEIPTIRLFERGGHIDLNGGKFSTVEAFKEEKINEAFYFRGRQRNVDGDTTEIDLVTQDKHGLPILMKNESNNGKNLGVVVTVGSPKGAISGANWASNNDRYKPASQTWKAGTSQVKAVILELN